MGKAAKVKAVESSLVGPVRLVEPLVLAFQVFAVTYLRYRSKNVQARRKSSLNADLLSKENTFLAMDSSSR